MTATDDPRYQALRRTFLEHFASATAVDGSSESFLAPSARFRLDTSEYTHGPTTWSYSRGVLHRCSDGHVIADVKRNYGLFWHAWVTHSNGTEYLLCGEDYQGYSVIDPAAGRVDVHFPEAAYSGAGFCWGRVFPSPDGNTLAVEGCYWGAPYQLVFFDFSDPHRLPLKSMVTVDDLNEAVGWTSSNSFDYTVWGPSDDPSVDGPVVSATWRRHPPP